MIVGWIDVTLCKSGQLQSIPLTIFIARIIIVEKEQLMKLFIIGNGFDIGHGLPTRYWDFRNYLEKNYPVFLKSFEEHYYIYSNMSDKEKAKRVRHDVNDTFQGIAGNDKRNAWRRISTRSILRLMKRIWRQSARLTRTKACSSPTMTPLWLNGSQNCIDKCLSGYCITRISPYSEPRLAEKTSTQNP